MKQLQSVLAGCVIALVGANALGAINDCVEEGPHYGAWILDNCPTQTTSPSVVPTQLYGNVDDAPCIPTVTKPSYADGSKHKEGTNDCPETPPPTNITASISYTVSEVRWEPPLPEKWNISHAQNSPFWSQAVVDITSSDPDLCPDSTQVIGTAYWYLSGIPATVTIEPEIEDVVAFFNQVGGVISKFGTCEGAEISASYGFSEERKWKYCDCESGELKLHTKTSGTGSISFGPVNCDIPIPSVSVPGVGGLFVHFNGGISVEVSRTGEKSGCVGDQKSCWEFEGSGTLGLGISAIAVSRKVLYVTGTGQIAVSYNLKVCDGNDPPEGEGCWDGLELQGKVVMFGGFSTSFSVPITDRHCVNYP